MLLPSGGPRPAQIEERNEKARIEAKEIAERRKELAERKKEDAERREEASRHAFKELADIKAAWELMAQRANIAPTPPTPQLAHIGPK